MGIITKSAKKSLENLSNIIIFNCKQGRYEIGKAVQDGTESTGKESQARVVAEEVV